MNIKTAKMLLGLGIIVALTISMTSGVQASSEKSPLKGLSKTQYERCIFLAKVAMSDMKVYGNGSSQHNTSYNDWSSECSLSALISVAEKNKNFPASPYARSILN